MIELNRIENRWIFFELSFISIASGFKTLIYFKQGRDTDDLMT